MPWCWSGPTPEALSASCIPRKARQTSGLRRGHPLAPQALPTLLLRGRFCITNGMVRHHQNSESSPAIDYTPRMIPQRTGA